MTSAPPAKPFRAETVDLTGDGRLRLARLTPGDAAMFGAAFAAIDPWAAYKSPPARLQSFFGTVEPDAPRWSIRSADGAPVGAVVIRAPWLHGPYLQFLGVLPGHQGGGAGAAVLHWMEREARPASRNLWLCVSAINTRGRAFYVRHGFEFAGTLDALVTADMDELLMRKRLF